MEKIINLNFCNLSYSEDDKDIEKEKELIKKAFEINKAFYSIEIKKFNIKLVYSRAALDDLWGSKTEDYVAAFARDEKIISLSYSIFDKETIWKKEEFFKTLLHEMNHLFYAEMRDDEYDPLWLSEGLATFVQHGQKRGEYKYKLKIERKILNENFEDMTIQSYEIYALFVEYLLINFGKEKLFEIIKGLFRKEKLEDLFQRVYNKNMDQLIEDGNKYQEIVRS